MTLLRIPTNVFLTGEAGTGKTTFLKRVLNETEKNCVVVAPTGVASINAGGSTIHSMFGLPTRMFLPTMDYVDPNQAQNIPMLQGHFKYPRVKRDIFNALTGLLRRRKSLREVWRFTYRRELRQQKNLKVFTKR